eukprot:226517-Hanusia_phi.AAC.1
MRVGSSDAAALPGGRTAGPQPDWPGGRAARRLRLGGSDGQSDGTWELESCHPPAPRAALCRRA